MQMSDADGSEAPVDGGLQVSPAKFLRFTAPFNRALKQEFQLHNKSSRERFCFKIKSNAPKNRLVVSPKIGIVEPGQTILHKVVLNPQQKLRPFNPPPSYGILVQTVPVGPQVANVDGIWDQVDVQKQMMTTKLECVYLEDGRDDVLRRKLKKVTLPGRAEAAALNQAFVGHDTVSLTVKGPGGLKKSVFDVQPVVQPPNTATVVFPSLGGSGNNLGELEIVHNNQGMVADSGDTNNNNKKDDSWADWNSPVDSAQQKGDTAATAAAASGWDDWGQPAAAAGDGQAANDDGWGLDQPPPPAQTAGANDGGWNDNNGCNNQNGGGVHNDQNDDWGGQNLQGCVAGDAWGVQQPPLPDYPPPIAGVDDQLRTLLAVALAAIAVFLFGMLLGKAGL